MKFVIGIKNSGQFVSLIKGGYANYIFLGNDGKTFYFQTDYNAPKGKVIAVDLDNPEQGNWKVKALYLHILQLMGVSGSDSKSELLISYKSFHTLQK